MSKGQSMSLAVTDLGRIGYADALALQRKLHAEVVAGRANEDGDGGRIAESPLGVDGGRRHVLLLLEHDPPVITISARATSRQNLIATPEQLARAGVEVAETDRGGDITYHGPGQLVVYPILDLNLLGLRLHGYMRLLEQIVIEILARFGIDGHRDEGATGVWVATPPGAQSVGFGSQSAKICAMGVRVSRWVSMHGLALNVTTDLSHFNLIVPCGLPGRPITSMQRELGDRCPTMEQVKSAIVERFEARLQQRALHSQG